MQTRDEVEGLHNCLEFPCLYQAMQTQKRFRLLKCKMTVNKITFERKCNNS